jgi:hypothetical protein
MEPIKVTEDTEIKFIKYFGHSRVTACMGFFCFKVDDQNIFFYNPSPPSKVFGRDTWSVDFQDTEFFLGIPDDKEDITSYFRNKEVKRWKEITIPKILQPAISELVSENLNEILGPKHCGGCS